MIRQQSAWIMNGEAMTGCQIMDISRVGAKIVPKSKRGGQSTGHWDRSAQSGSRHLSQRSLSNQRNAVKGAVKPGRANSIQPQVEPIGRLSIIFHIQRVALLILSGIMARSSKLVAVRRGKVLLVRRRRDRRWMFPGGRERARENEKDCLRREIREELLRIPTKSPGYNGMMSPGIPE
jgi:NUDIX domain